MISRTLDMDFDALYHLQSTMQDNAYLEYMFHKLFENSSWTWSQAQQYPPVWTFPECWRARYWLYYQRHRQYLQHAHILDLGSNMNFYGVWALLNGAERVEAVEPDPVRHGLGREYADLRGVGHRLQTHNTSLQQYLSGSDLAGFDVVFFMDVIYYLTNGPDMLDVIKNQVRPKYMFFESSVVDDCTARGHYEVWYPSTDSKKIQSFPDKHTSSITRLALKPSRKALYNTLTAQGWRIISYYDYQDFIGHGESPPRRSGHKDFYLLENPTGIVRH